MEKGEKQRNIALILAGGHGGRMQAGTPKQFLMLRGMPVILHTLLAFERHPEVDEIDVVCLSGWEDWLRRLAGEYRVSKLCQIYPAGENSHVSIRNGVEGLCSRCSSDDIVLVHEAVRPLVSARTISENIRVCRTEGNAITAVRDNEAVMYSEDGASSSRCFPREQMYKAQTPQTFRLGDLQEAYREAAQRSVCSQSLYTLMADLRRYPLFIAEGDRRNIKLTHPEDIRVAEILLTLNND